MEEAQCRRLPSVERDRAVTAEQRNPGAKVLHRETKRVKLNGNPIVSGKTAYRKQILNDSRSKKNIVKIKWSR